MIKDLSTIILLTIIVTGCSLLGERGETPAYIYIEEATVSTGISQGAPTSKITDIWIDADGQFLGIFQLPADVPVILPEDGSDPRITLFPVVRANGINSTPEIYPFYERIDVPLGLEPLKTDTINPVFSYYETSQFRIVEGFEGGNIFSEDHDEDSDSRLEVIADIGSNGNRIGQIQINEENPLNVVRSRDRLELPTDGSPVWLELDYKCDIPFRLGLVGYEGLQQFTNYKIVLTPQEEWNKIYIDFSIDLSLSGLESYSVVFNVEKIAESEEGTLEIDNVKLIHF